MQLICKFWLLREGLRPQLKNDSTTPSAVLSDPGTSHATRAIQGAGFNVDAYDGSVPRLVAAAQCAAWSPLFHNLSPGSFAQAKALGLSVIPWTVNDRAQMQQLIALGVDGIITDYPNRLRALMAENGMPLPRAVPVH